MKVLARSKLLPGATMEQVAPHLREEARQVWQLYTAGVVREMYMSHDRAQAILVLEAADLAEAERALSALPLVQQGLLGFDLTGLAPFVPLAGLFSP
jgi:hypothetical protein